MLTACLALLLAAGLTSAAHAQLGDPGEDTLDTDVTPVAKESERWDWWAGARYNGTPDPADVPEGSVTPFELDFFDVAFRDANSGLAGGAVCREPVPAGASQEEALAHTTSCERVPALYRYSVDEVEGASWSPVDLGESTSPRGYIGAIAWLDANKALIVGGDGCYPRREEPCPDGDTPLTPQGDPDPAGMARAWIYADGSARELTPLPAQMRGLTALGAPFFPGDATERYATERRLSDCDSGGVDTQWGCATAGGLRQVWQFRDGVFVRGWSGDASAPATPERGDIFQFRVRDLRFAPNVSDNFTPGGNAPQIRAVGVTAGCCGPDPAKSGPRILVFDGDAWYVRQRDGDLSNIADVFGAESQRRPVGPSVDRQWDTAEFQVNAQLNKLEDERRDQLGKCFRNQVACLYNDGLQPDTPLNLDDLIFPDGFDEALGPWPIGPWDVDLGPTPVDGSAVDDAYAQEHGELERQSRPYGAAAQVPDSYYALFSLTGANFSLVASPGGPAPDGSGGSGPEASEPASHVFSASAQREPRLGQSQAPAVFTPSLSISQNRERLLTTARLISADHTPLPITAFGEEERETPPNHFEAVGALRSSGQGIAFGPRERDPHRVNESPQDKEATGCDTSEIPPQCEPDAERFITQQRSLRLFKLDSYALNAIDVLDDPLEGGAGWAVGDHGAIHSLEGQTAAQAQAHEPDPPPLGQRRQEPLPDASAYDAYRKPLTAEPGTVPPLGASPEVERFDSHRFVPAGEGVPSPVVMSRDGSEGWAIKGNAISYFDGLVWRPCRAGAGTPEPSCPDLGPLASGNASVGAIVRIPLENDDDPSNDDEFELLAFSGGKALVYRDGRWRYDDGPLGNGIGGATSAAFVTPDDGWADSTGISHFDGDGWTACTGPGAAPDECGDPEGRLSIGSEEKASPFSPLGSGAPLPRLVAAGGRVYLFGTRMVRASTASGTGIDPVYPLILYRDPGGTWKGSADGSDGGLDPGFFAGGEDTPRVEPPKVDPAVDLVVSLATQPANALAGIAANELKRQLEGGSAEGRVYGLGVTEGQDGEIEGWAVGEFGGKGSDAKAVMLRLAEGRWGAWPVPDASDDYLHFSLPTSLQLTALSTPAGAYDALLTGVEVPLAYNADRARWEALDLPFVTRSGRRPSTATQWNATPEGIAPDNRGGLWVSAGTLYHYTDRALKPVFREVPSPVRDGTITASAAGGDGSFWLGTDSDVLYRYDRLVGWDSVRIPGWEAGRVVIDPAEVSDIAIASDGRGVAVGEGGRIAEIGPEGARLDEAAGTVCDLGAPRPPCGTGRDLTAAAVAPDGSALVGGRGLTSLLYRPAGGEFRIIEPPPRQPASSVVHAVALPTSDRAYLVLGPGGSGNRLFRGERVGAGFRWELEFETGEIQGIEVAPSGHGYALVKGRVLERSQDGEWGALPTGYEGRIGTIAAPPNGATGLIAGGGTGLVLTLQDGRLRPAHWPDLFSPLRGNVSSGGYAMSELAVLPGPEQGQVEAWAVAQGSGGRHGFDRQEPTNALYHYASDPSLDPSASLRSLPDAPPARPGELAFAAFGKQDCHKPAFDCFEVGGNRTHAAISRRIVDELVVGGRRPGGPMFALHTGDGVDSPTPERTGLSAISFSSTAQTPASRDLKVARFIEHTADPLTDAGVPLLGAIGGQDLTTRHAEGCASTQACAGDQGVRTISWDGFQPPSTGAGTNAEWRRATAIAPAPWERPGGIEEGSLGFEPVEDPLSLQTPEAEVQDPRTGETLKAGVPYSVVAGLGLTRSPEVRAEARRGGRTHYAFDVVDESQDGRELARIVVVDSSLGSLAASDAQSEPKEPGGQLAWLERMLCIEGSAQDTDGDAQDCTREPGQRAIVLTNRPTYAYAQIDPAKLLAESTVFEALLLRYDVDVLVTGHVGWNGLYYACAPGLHYPAPGQGYPTRAPRGIAECAAASTGTSEQASEATNEAAGALAGAGADALPVVVASGAGGVLADPNGEASDGYWHGYSVVHLDTETGEVRVEQRPVFNWVAIRGDERALEPGQRMTLQGYGRETFGQETPVRHLEIDSPALTHRYDLLLADPDDPRVPCRSDDSQCTALASKLAGGSRSFDSAGGGAARAAHVVKVGASASASAAGDANACEPYVCLPENVASVDPVTGDVRAGNGRYPDTFAIGMLSVGDHVATYPLVFKRSPSFIVAPAVGSPALPSAPASTGTAPSPPPPPNPPTPHVPQVNTPAPPLPPPVPPLEAAQPPEPQPPAPPAPPPPSEQPAPLSLTLAPPSIAIATPTAVIQPPTPPVNPAPPGGARREARQRQAATQKSGADSAEGGTQHDVDLAQGPSKPEGSGYTRHESSFTRTDRTRPAPSFTTLSGGDSAGSGSAGPLYIGGITLLALAAAAGWTTGRPTPRRRSPDVPAPGWSQVRGPR